MYTNKSVNQKVCGTSLAHHTNVNYSSVWILWIRSMAVYTVHLGECRCLQIQLGELAKTVLNANICKNLIINHNLFGVSC